MDLCFWHYKKGCLISLTSTQKLLKLTTFYWSILWLVHLYWHSCQKYPSCSLYQFFSLQIQSHNLSQDVSDDNTSKA
jgi:putative component of membrane protein insertase Oxa1/YidC/SpoIIIJ protein YidD